MKKSSYKIKSSSAQEVSDTMAPYLSAASSFESSILLELNDSLSGIDISSMVSLFSDKLLLTDIISRGITYKLFEKISKYAPLTSADWSDILDLSPKTLNRYKLDKRSFGPLQSERIMELLEVCYLGYGYFKDREKFELWMKTPNMSLARRHPKSLLTDSYGKDLVLRALIHLEHGIYV